MNELQTLKCPNCGAPLKPGSTICVYCGNSDFSCPESVPTERDFVKPSGTAQTSPPNADFSARQARAYTAPSAEDVFAAPPPAAVKPKPGTAYSSRHIIAFCLAFLLGGIGGHFFFLGKIGAGIACVLFCWTAIPAVVSFIHGIVLAAATETAFAEKYGV